MKIKRGTQGPELVARRVRWWLEERQRQTILIAPGTPWDMTCVERFIGTLRGECLNRYLFDDLKEARKVLESWR